MSKILLLILLYFYSNLISCQPIDYMPTADAKSDLAYMVSTIESVHYNAYFKMDSYNL
jgi:hypothetical protein